MESQAGRLRQRDSALDDGKNGVLQRAAQRRIQNLSGRELEKRHDWRGGRQMNRRGARNRCAPVAGAQQRAVSPRHFADMTRFAQAAAGRDVRLNHAYFAALYQVAAPVARHGVLARRQRDWRTRGQFRVVFGRVKSFYRLFPSRPTSLWLRLSPRRRATSLSISRKTSRPRPALRSPEL